MLDIRQPYAPDLEWMLLSGQVDREALLEALLEEYYAAVYRLALSFLDDHTAAQSAARQTFARALLDQHRYRPQDGLQLWLFRLALQACQHVQPRLQRRRTLQAWLPRWGQERGFGDSTPETAQDAGLWLALDSLEDHARQALLLQAANGWQPERIAALFHTTESEIEAVLAASRRLIAAAPPLAAESPSKANWSGEAANLDLKESLKRRWPERTFSASELRIQASQILRRLGWLGFRRTKILAAVELTVLGLIILLAFALIWSADRLADEQATAMPSEALPTRLATRLVTQIVTATPLTVIVSKPTNTPISVAYSYYTEIRPDEDLQAVAKRLGVAEDELREWNRLPQDAEIHAGERLINPQAARRIKLRTAIPASPSTPLPTLQEPLSVSSFASYLARKDLARGAYWIDAMQIDYGPLSYIGPPRLRHIQQWMSKNQSLSLNGAYANLPDEVIMSPNKNQRFIAKPASDLPWFSEWRTAQAKTNLPQPTTDPLREALLNPRIQERDSTVQIVGREAVAGRSAVVMDLFGSDGKRAMRLWVDDSLILVLRQIQYHNSDHEAPISEYRINRLEQDVDFPQHLFDFHLPWRGGYAQDARGIPLALDAALPEVALRTTMRKALLAPAGFDLSHSQLTFQYAGQTADFSPEAQFEIYADDFFLGQAFLGDPWSMICDRSPDGRWLAYASRPAQSHDPGSMLHWFDLSQPAARYYTLYSQTGISEMAFSADSQRLAYFSQPDPAASGALYILELPDQNSRLLYTTGDIKSLVWSPDGKYLAFINRVDPAVYIENVLVISATSSEVIYDSPLDILNGVARDWPMGEWDVDFPVEMGGMDVCAAPPEP